MFDFINKRKLPSYKHLTSNKEIIDLTKDKEINQFLYFPMIFSNNEDLNLKISLGDKIKKYQTIGVKESMGLTINSPVSGEFIAIEKLYCSIVRRNIDHVVIKNDFKDEILKEKEKEIKSKEDLIEKIKNAGIIGLGGAGFPTYIKYKSENINTIIINAIESEPYLTSDYVSLKNNPEFLLDFVIEIKKFIDVNFVVVIKRKYKELGGILKDLFIDIPYVKIHRVSGYYPISWERIVVKKVTGKTYQKYPSEKGIIVNNIQTCMEVGKALKYNEKLTTRIVTFAGENFINNTNAKLLIGSRIDLVIKKLDGYKNESTSLYVGGVMTGKTILTDVFPLPSHLSSLTALTKKEEESSACMKCGRCNRFCPLNLNPIEIKKAFDEKDIEKLNKLDINKCINCGLCSFVCPSKIELTDFINRGKLYNDLMNKKAKK